MYDDKLENEKGIVISKKASSERSMVPAVQYRKIGCLEDCSREAWCQGYLKYYVYVDSIGLETYGPMVITTERPVLLDPTGKNVGLPEPGTAESVDILKLLWGRLGKDHTGKARQRKPQREALNKTENTFC